MPGFVGAFAGATLLVNLDADAARPVVAVLLLGARRLRDLALPDLGPRGLRFRRRPSRPLPGADRAWSPAPSTRSAAAAGGRSARPRCSPPGRLEPRKVVGSVDTAEFVVAVGGSLGFLAALGSQGIAWPVVGALLVGGVVAAPIAALVVRLLAPRVLGVSAGGLIVLTNLQTLADSMDASGITIGLLASVVFTLWVLWIAWAVKLEQQPTDPAR